MSDSFKHFMKLHRGLPQQAPGSRASTLRALRELGKLPARPQILDLGCGPGRHTLDLVEATGGRAAAIDLLPTFVLELRERAAAAGLGERVTPLQGSMAELGGLPEGAFHLIWSEGAIYNVGFEWGLSHWRRLVHPEGGAAVTEATWLVPDPPAEARAFWDDAYPPMTDLAGNRAAAERAGWRVVGDFAVPGKDWWDDYYTPLEQRIAAWRAENPPAEVLAVLDQASHEAAIHRDHGHSYGYVFYLLRPG
ncbi:MAG: class I SAM-dependent methyltransferase [Myxococcales bacterium]|nr:class I SAM-dependent methyltransferase [Myxococcales bacterium]MDD9970420.1 class I SAM-dependent methyltransferase [Myxococcales bacterium]